ncbi:MAG: hypothetical protein OQJ89_10880 [Kangiellaceae bacterium]|nr:hypothetical protein [Kangiellaceae bacterium]MCW8999038.1 hypothetical protein [Kangiellaceae bacterium]MCW9017461.1 hypothetical protein [Kangiellaceae bacterium]
MKNISFHRAVKIGGAKIRLVFICTFFLLTSCIGAQSTQPEQKTYRFPLELNGIWVLKVENLQRELVATLKIKFSAKKAASCIGGDWRNIIVESYQTTDESFFPATEPLSYELNGNQLKIGRNQICDAYLNLSGELKDFYVNGEYIGFGWETKKLGYFSLSLSE